LRCGGTGLPTQLVVLAKILILCELWTNQVAGLPGHFLPFLPFFEYLGSPEVFQRTLQVLFLVASFGILFNRRVQACCLLFGLVIITAMLSSRVYFGNNRFYVGCLLYLIGLYTPKFGPRLIQFQVVLIYFGAALNKILLPDWWSGQFFENWVKVLDQQLFMQAATWFPHMMLAKLTGWFTITAESALAVGLLVRRWNPWAIWLGIFLHSSMLWFAGSTFTLFFYAGIAAYLAFVEWPKPPLTVLYDGDCGFCEKTKNVFARFDLEGTFEWVPFQKARNLYGISTDALKERLHFVAHEKVYAGYRAFEIQCRALTIQAYHTREPYHTWRKTGFARILMQTGKSRDPRIADTPTIYELMNEHKTADSERRLLPLILAASDFGRPMVAPPGVPPARVKILREAFLKTLADSELLAEAKRKNLDITPTPGEELQELAKQVMVQTPEVVARVKTLME
jgi:predicted DCC family thiol-disulfide oxidoreductase YuxK